MKNTECHVLEMTIPFWIVNMYNFVKLLKNIAFSKEHSQHFHQKPMLKKKIGVCLLSVADDT